MKLILVRHGRSIANNENKDQGEKGKWRNTSLHEKGIKQSKEVAERLKDEKIDIIYSSPLKRTMETAKEINKFHKLKIITDERLEEYKNEEDKEEFIQRCKSFLDEVEKKDKKILIVSHGGVILTLLAISTGNRKKGGKFVRDNGKKVRNTSTSIIEKNGNKFTRPLLFDSSHRSD